MIQNDDCIHIKLFKNAVQVIDETITNGMNVVKTIKLEDFIKALSESEFDYSSPILPSNCIKYKEKGNEVIVLLAHEETTFTANCGGQVYTNCVRPNILMVYSLRKDDQNQYSICGTRAYAIKDSVNLINQNTVLWGLPFPNIGTDGYVCWGSNSVAGSFKSLVGLRSYVERIFSSPFNNHLFNSSSLVPFGIRTNHDLFQFLQNKDHFPYEILENLGSKKTIGSI